MNLCSYLADRQIEYIFLSPSETTHRVVQISINIKTQCFELIFSLDLFSAEK